MSNGELVRISKHLGESPFTVNSNSGETVHSNKTPWLQTLSPKIRRVLISFAVASLMLGVASTLYAQEPAVEPKPSEMSFLVWIAHVSGIIGLFILILSIYFVTIVVRNFLELRMPVAVPEDVQASVNAMIEQKNYRELQSLLTQDGSHYSEVLAAGVGELRYGLEEARNRMDLHSETLTTRMERRIANMAVIGTLGPMIGLLGTLKGMIAAFSEIAMSGVALDAGKVADAISEALVLTFEGVLLSIPATYFYSFFRNRIAQIRTESMEVADAQLKEIAMGLRKQTGRDGSSAPQNPMGQ